MEKSYGHLGEMPGSKNSAERCVPAILAAVGGIRSVVDLGGGDGGWLRVFQQHGVKQVMLIDCPEVAPHLVINKGDFLPCDLSRDLPSPRRFDLAVCLECAEHLPAHRAGPLVEWLTKSADIVVFSAAIPGQYGHGHINLRFPDFWEGLFAVHGYRKHDLLRAKIVNDQAIAWWYRQNMVVFASPTVTFPKGSTEFLSDEFFIIHKDIANSPRGPKTLLRELGPALVSAIRRRVFGLKG
jgi:hypothetical protein